MRRAERTGVRGNLTARSPRGSGGIRTSVRVNLAPPWCEPERIRREEGRPDHVTGSSGSGRGRACIGSGGPVSGGRHGSPAIAAPAAHLLHAPASRCTEPARLWPGRAAECHHCRSYPFADSERIHSTHYCDCNLTVCCQSPLRRIWRANYVGRGNVTSGRTVGVGGGVAAGGRKSLICNGAGAPVRALVSRGASTDAAVAD